MVKHTLPMLDARPNLGNLVQVRRVAGERNNVKCAVIVHTEWDWRTGSRQLVLPRMFLPCTTKFWKINLYNIKKYSTTHTYIRRHTTFDIFTMNEQNT